MEKSNYLITANIILNCCISGKEKSRIYKYFVQQLSSLGGRFNFYITELDFYLAFFIPMLCGLDSNQTYFNYYYQILDNLTICKTDASVVETSSIFQVNPLDAIRFSTALDHNLDGIITWEPLHYIQTAEDKVTIQREGKGNIFAALSKDLETGKSLELRINIFSLNAFFRSIGVISNDFELINEAEFANSVQQIENPGSRSVAALLSQLSEFRSEFSGLEKLAKETLDFITNGESINDSVFAERMLHYRNEKEFISEQYIRSVLEPRINYLRQKKNYKEIRIIFDSGTTIAPMFTILGREAEQDPDYWCKNISVVTNNIKGLANILRFRENYNDPYARLPLHHFFVLPGEILPAFEAIASEQTLKALDDYRKDDVYTISVTTGNYILLHEGKFLPIARAGYHPDFKATLFDISDEVYVIAPLGKILMCTEERKVRHRQVTNLLGMLTYLNRDLDLVQLPSPRTQESDNKEYKLVNKKLVWRNQKTKVWDIDSSDWLRKSVLVTTSRKSNCLLYPHSERVKNELRKPMFEIEWDKESGPHFIAFPFDDLPILHESQYEVEIPHSNLQKCAENYLFLLSADSYAR